MILSLSHPPTVILRHRRENLAKCSLRGLETQADLQFYAYPLAHLPSLQDYLLLDIEGPLLTEADAGHGLLLLDATWRYALRMKQFVTKNGPISCRRLPNHFRTAYPRRQDDCHDPERGLASVEALFLAYWLLNRDGSRLLDHYYWKEKFLNINQLTLDK